MIWIFVRIVVSFGLLLFPVETNLIAPCNRPTMMDYRLCNRHETKPAAIPGQTDPAYLTAPVAFCARFPLPTAPDPRRFSRPTERRALNTCKGINVWNSRDFPGFDHSDWALESRSISRKEFAPFSQAIAFQRKICFY
ncbi:hypothetical protein [Mesorhizobium sp. M0678]|uniref:hypothetical protein n=1 Tax=Mesorhizobium sp. M0678 TaxID=2956985 RepID=UPI00333976B7